MTSFRFMKEEKWLHISNKVGGRVGGLTTNSVEVLANKTQLKSMMKHKKDD